MTRGEISVFHACSCACGTADRGLGQKEGKGGGEGIPRQRPDGAPRAGKKGRCTSHGHKAGLFARWAPHTLARFPTQGPAVPPPSLEGHRFICHS